MDTSTDGDITSEGALVIDESSLNGSLGGLETKTDLPHITDILSL